MAKHGKMFRRTSHGLIRKSLSDSNSFSGCPASIWSYHILSTYPNSSPPTPPVAAIAMPVPRNSWLRAIGHALGFTPCCCWDPWLDWLEVSKRMAEWIKLPMTFLGDEHQSEHFFGVNRRGFFRGFDSLTCFDPYHFEATCFWRSSRWSF